MEPINSIIQQKDMRSFRSYLDHLYGDDINKYILIENDATKLNLLHILSGAEPFTSFLGDCIRELLKRPNADIDAVGVIDNNYGITAAHIAVQWRKKSILKILVEHNPDLLKCDSFGKTVQDYAEEDGNEETMNIIDKAIEKWYTNNHDQYESILKTSTRKSPKRNSLYSSSSSVHTMNSSRHNSYSEDLCDKSKEQSQVVDIWQVPNNPSSNNENYCDETKQQSEVVDIWQIPNSSSLNNEDFCDKSKEQSQVVDTWHVQNDLPSNSKNYCDESKEQSKIDAIWQVQSNLPSYSENYYNESNEQSQVADIWQVQSNPTSYSEDFCDKPKEQSEVVDTWQAQNSPPSLKESSSSNHFQFSTLSSQTSVLSSQQTVNANKKRLDDFKRLSAASDVSYVPSTIHSSLESQVSEVYLYKDEAYNIQFLEERFNGASRLIDEQSKAEIIKSEWASSFDGSGNASSSFNRSTESVESTIDELILKMTNTQLFDHLVEKGEKPGPVNDRTKRLYQKKANRMINKEPLSHISFLNEMKSVMLGKTVSDKDTAFESEEEAAMMAKLASYPLEFTNLVKRRFPFEEAIKYENMLIKEAERIESQYVDGIQRGSSSRNTFFSYLLLDPDITDNLPARANICLEKMLLIGVGDSDSRPAGGLLELLDPKLFAAFILAIFYVGKGCNARAYAHFYEAFKAMDPSYNKGPRASANARPSPKVEKICSIWRKGKGPISLHCFQGISENEALTREALMIDVLSLSNLTNNIGGQYRCKLELNRLQRNILGTYLLFKAFIILLLNGERQVKMPEK